MATNAEQNQLKKAQDSGEGEPQAPGTGASTPSAPASRVAGFSSGQQPTSQGSGRFTNLNKYVNANQGAGDQLGSKITSSIDKNVQKTQKEAQTQAQGVASAVQAEKDRLAQGSTFNQQLQNQNEDQASQIYNDEGNRSRFSNLLNNQNVATNLKTQAQTAGDKATAGFNSLGQQVQNLGTEQGRFNLLQQSVKQPGYTTGQQRLDQLFLQTGNPNNLVNSQRQLQGQVNTAGQNLTNQFTDLGSQIGQVGTQAEDVSKLLGGTLNTQTQNLINAQQAQAQGLNTSNAAGNAALQTYFTNGYGSLTPEQKATIDPLLQSGGLTNQTRTYNVLQDPQSYQNYITQGRTNLSQGDVVDQSELNRYNSLFGLAGGTGTKAFNAVGDAGPAAGLQGEKLGSAINTAKTNFENLLGNTNAVGSGSTLFGGTGIGASPMTAVNFGVNQNMMNLLRQKEAGNLENANQLASTGTASGYYDNTGDALLQQIQERAGSLGGDKSAAALGSARQQALEQFLAQLQSGGYNNLLGGS